MKAKNLILIAASILTTVFVAASVVPAHAAQPVYGSNDVWKDGPEVPFPLSVPVEFPWSNINGVWQVSSAQQTAWFSLEAGYDGRHRQVLRVLQIDPATHAVVARGLGIEKGEQIRAVMTGRHRSYVVFIGAYKKSKSRRAHVYTVITVRGLNDASDNDQSFQAGHLSAIPYRSQH